MFVGKGKKRFTKEGHLLGKDSQLAPLRFEKMPLHSNDVSEIELFFDEFEVGELAHWSESFDLGQIPVAHDLNAARLILNMRKSISLTILL